MNSLNREGGAPQKVGRGVAGMDPIYCIPHTYVYKWKNHFYEMKGDVGMSLHEKERNKKMPT